MPINRGARGIAIEIEIDDRNCLDNQVVNFTKQNFLETSYREYISYSGSPLWLVGVSEQCYQMLELKVAKIFQ